MSKELKQWVEQDRKSRSIFLAIEGDKEGATLLLGSTANIISTISLAVKQNQAIRTIFKLAEIKAKLGIGREYKGEEIII